MKENTETKTVKAKVKHPLFKIYKNGESAHLLIIARSVADALSKAQTIWTRNKAGGIISVEIKHSGTVDYIPALKKPHWES